MDCSAVILLGVAVVWFGSYVTSSYEDIILLNTLVLLFIGGCNKEQATLVITSLIVGSVFDLLLNGYSRIVPKHYKRSKGLRNYFNKVGTIKASYYGGTLASLMIMNTYALTEIFTDKENKNITENVITGLTLAFIVGAIWGVLGKNSVAMKPLLPFYRNTSGMLENRFWDGISITLALGVVYLLRIAFDQIPLV